MVVCRGDGGPNYSGQATPSRTRARAVMDLREVSQRLAKAHGRGGQGKHLQTTSRIQSKNRRVPKNSNNELSKYWRMFLNFDAFKASKAQNAGPSTSKQKQV